MWRSRVARGRNLKRGHPDDPREHAFIRVTRIHATMLLKPVNGSDGKHMASGLSTFFLQAYEGLETHGFSRGHRDCGGTLCTAQFKSHLLLLPSFSLYYEDNSQKNMKNKFR